MPDKRSSGERMYNKGLSILITIVVISMILLPSSSGGISFVKDIDATKDKIQQKNMDMEVFQGTNRTNIYLVYEEISLGGNTGSVIFKRSIDGGSTWDTEKDMMVNKTGLNKQIQPSLDIQENGRRLVLVYMDSQYREIPSLVEFVIVCLISDDEGSTWKKSIVTPLSSVDYPSDEIKEPEVAVGPEGEIAVAWIDLEDDDKVVASLSVDDGRTWSNPVEAGGNISVENPRFRQWSPSIACDGDHVHISLMEDSKYRPQVFYSRSTIKNGTLSPFSYNLLMSRDLPVNYQSYYPVIDCDGSGLHIAWWDFVTDRTGTNNEDMENDRPCIKYSRSLDNGSTWKVGSRKDLMINGSYNDAWISPPSLSSRNGSLAIGWWDMSLDHPAVFISRSGDGGSSWSDPVRASGFRKDIFIENVDVGINDNGDVVTSWIEFGPTEDRDIFISTSVESIKPDPVSGLELLMVNETTAWIKWKPYTGPDLRSFTILLSTNSSFPLRETSFPMGSSYLEFTAQDLSTERLSELNAGTVYYCSIQKTDGQGNAVLSKIISFETLPGNQPPQITTKLPDLSIPEGSTAEIVMNLSEMTQNGTIIDDSYNGFQDLEFELEPMKNDSIIDAGVYTLNGHQFVELTVSESNWHGSEEFRLVAIDPGWDGIFGNGDDISSFSNWFTIEVYDVNDAPYWIYWREVLSGSNLRMASDQRELEISPKLSACVEDIEYEFILKADDVDGDPITFSCSDNRVKISSDNADPRTTARFKFTPCNNDLPSLNLKIFATDRKGGQCVLDLSIGIQNTNDEPYFTEYDNGILPPNGGTLTLSYLEGDELNFSISGSDPDPVWDLDLFSNSNILEIIKTGEGSWNISLDERASRELPDIFRTTLELYDRDGGGPSILYLELERIDLQNPPVWSEPYHPIKMTALEDIEQNDDNGPIGPEWNELVRFGTDVIDIDDDPLEFKWTFSCIDRGSSEEYTGNPVDVRFHPEFCYNDLGEMKYRVDLTVFSAGSYLNHSMEIFVNSDGDDDNDGLDDDLEVRYFGDLTQGPDDDPDNDGFSNLIEMHSHDGYVTDPTDENDPPRYIDDDDDKIDEIEGTADPGIIMMIIGIMAALISLAGGILFIVRRERKKEEEEDLDIERRVQAMKERQEEISSIYGKMKADSVDFGPDQSTMDDIKIETGTGVYHGQIIIREGGWEENEKRRGPDETALSTNGEGPLFGNTLEITP